MSDKEVKRPKAKMIGLTFSRCETSKEDCLKKIQEIFGKHLRRWVISREKHTGVHGAKGEHHLHVFIELNESLRLPLTKFDEIAGVHPNIMRVKYPAMWLGYLLKEDTKPLSNFDVVEQGFKSYTGSKRNLVFSLLDTGMTEDQILTMFRKELRSEDMAKIFRFETMCNNAERMNTFRNKKGLKHIDREIIKDTLTTEELVEFDSWDGYQKIIDHVNDITKYGFYQPRPSDKRVLMLVGKSGIGKSTLWIRIADAYSTYRFPLQNWHPKYRDGLYKVILWDEPRWMPSGLQGYLLMFDGLPVDWPVKGSHVVREDHQKIVMLTNRPLDKHISAFRRGGMIDEEKEALGRRIDEINAEDRNLFFLIKIIESSTLV